MSVSNPTYLKKEMKISFTSSSQKEVGLCANPTRKIVDLKGEIIYQTFKNFLAEFM